MESQRDSIADAFEVFIGNALKGEHGQFFTPRNVIRFILKYLDKNFISINSNIKIMDPACGTGGFIVEALDFVWKKINISNKNELQKKEEQLNFAQTKIYGIDKDKFVAKVTKAYMCILGDGTSNVMNKDSLQSLEEHYDTVDLLLTNPPFGKKIKIKNNEILNNYSLKSNGSKGTNPEVLFIELSVKLLKENGIMVIVVPEGIIGNYNDKYIRKFLNNNGKIISIVSLPIETFKPHTGIKSSIIIFQKYKIFKDYNTVLIDIKKIGNDKNGKTLYKINDFGEPLKDKEGHFIVDDEMDNFYNII
ncbi:class I SAM-dependent DNA methyltransferase [Spiroplasma sp. ald]|uniref:class I SAM-dependent DNA methyltransferase n=1 Tax=Spiroplasma sp. ald TaxID=2490849 RepID=UPI0037DD9E04